VRVLLGVTGGIAAYKVATVLRRLKEDGHDVTVVPTPASLNLVGRATWEALSGHPAPSETFENVEATSLLSNAILATSAPVLVAPAMHSDMWQNAATQANVATLKERGVAVLEPAVGRLAGEDSGIGRLPEPSDIVAALNALAQKEKIPQPAQESRHWGDLTGVRVLVSAGGTREAIDPVRFIGNRSTGHQGFAIAEAARERGATVTVVAANVALPLGEGIARSDVETAVGLAREMREISLGADVVIMAAAVADFRPASASATKIKKGSDGHLTLELEENEDVLASLVKDRQSGQIVVGFAAETGDDAGSVEEHGAEKARRKGADLTVVNAVGEGIGFGDVKNRITIFDAGGEKVAEAEGDKGMLAHAILDAVVERRVTGKGKKAKRVRGWVGGAR
jgi:phosphopantothenoylcysteine decarboxylase/phosphopantothenate--cysteine ligase